jgi:hypothetical protein
LRRSAALCPTPPRRTRSRSRPRTDFGIRDADRRQSCRRRPALSAPCREFTSQARNVPGRANPLAILWLRRPRQNRRSNQRIGSQEPIRIGPPASLRPPGPYDSTESQSTDRNVRPTGLIDRPESS